MLRPSLPCQPLLLPRKLLASMCLAFMAATAGPALVLQTPPAFASPIEPISPEETRFARGMHPVFGADAVVLFTPDQTTAPIIGGSAEQPHYLQGSTSVLTPGVPANVALALPPNSFTGGFTQGQALKLYLKKHPSELYYYPIYRQPADLPTIPAYTGPLLDMQADLRVLQRIASPQGPMVRELPALTLSEGPISLPMFLRLSGTYALTAVDAYLLVQAPLQAMQSMRRVVGTDGTPRYEVAPDTVPLASNLVLGPSKEFTAGSADAAPSAEPPALTYHIAQNSPPGLYSFHIVVVPAGADPYNPAQWMQFRTANIFVAP